MIKQDTSVQKGGLSLPGLDGSNPLGFLAALGLFRIVEAAFGADGAQMQWTPGNGTWVPRITSCPINADTLLDLLEKDLPSQIDQHPINVLDNLSSCNEVQRRQLFQQIASDHYKSDWLAALASDFAPTSANNQLQTARRDYYLGNLASVISRTTRDHLERAIFYPWDYADPLDNQSLHLDPSEDRRHAHQWNTPAGDPDRKKAGGMLGANRLAIEAIMWFTSLPADDALRTVGFTGQRSRNTRWTWPIWNVPLTSATIRSTLVLAELQEPRMAPQTAAQLRRRGVAAAFRTARILVGKTPNFTPAERIA